MDEGVREKDWVDVVYLRAAEEAVSRGRAAIGG